MPNQRCNAPSESTTALSFSYPNHPQERRGININVSGICLIFICSTMAAFFIGTILMSCFLISPWSDLCSLIIWMMLCHSRFFPVTLLVTNISATLRSVSSTSLLFIANDAMFNIRFDATPWTTPLSISISELSFSHLFKYPAGSRWCPSLKWLTPHSTQQVKNILPNQSCILRC